MERIAVLLQKEWLELRKERSVLATMLVLPLILTALGVGITAMLGRIPDQDTSQLGAALADPALAGLPLNELSQVIVGRQFGTILLLLPMLLPGLLAAYAVVGEKTRHTLEPLLATPIRTWELLLAKCLAALIPAMLLTWGAAALFAAGVTATALTSRVAGLILSPAWTLLLLLCAPLLGLITVALAVLVSSRVNDPRSAQNLTGIVVIPLMLLFAGQLVGLVVVNLGFVLLLAALLAPLAALLLWQAARLFRRESILTRWA